MVCQVSLCNYGFGIGAISGNSGHANGGGVEANGTTYYVNNSTGDDNRTDVEAENSSTPWKTISHAVTNASAGDTITVAAGTYYETIDVTVDGLTIQSLSGNPSDTIIDGADDTVIVINHYNHVTISGFTITGGGGSIDYQGLNLISGIFMRDATGCHLSNLIITDITPGGTGQWTTGICISESSSNTFESIIISNISGSAEMAGLLLDGAVLPSNSNNSFTDITIDTLTQEQGGAIQLSGLFLWDFPNDDNTFDNIKITNLAGSWVEGLTIKGAYNNTFESTEISSLNSTYRGGDYSKAIALSLRDGAHNNTFNATTISDITASGEASGVRVYYGWTHDNSFTSTSISGLTGTPSYGIYVRDFSESNSFNGGSISGAQRGVYIKGNCPSNSIHYTDIVGNAEYGAYSDTVTLDATNNWWGDASGPNDPTGTNEVPPCTTDPTTEKNADGTGDKVSDNVDYCPWLILPYGQVATATGAGIASFSTSDGIIEDLTAVAEGTLPTAGKPDVAFPLGFFSFRITGLAIGQTVVVTITLPSAMPVGTQYWKYHEPEGWINVTSLLGDNDGDNVLTLTLTDGGLGDDDGAANGTIVDQGGPAIPPAGPPPAVGGTAYPPNKVVILAPWIALAAAIIAGATIFLRRRRAQS